MRAVIATTILLVAVSALAQIDPDLDQVGVYWDTGATEICRDLVLFEPNSAYLCLTNPSATAAIIGWGIRVELIPPPLIPPSYFIMSEGENLGGHALPDFVVALDPPLPPQPVVVLMRIQVTPLEATEFVIALGAVADPFFAGVPGYATVEDPHRLIPCGYATGAPGPQAIANPSGDCWPVGSGARTWGGIKALFD